MVLCPIALAVGCKRCFLVKICPVKRILGDFPKKVAEAKDLEEKKEDQDKSQ
ncbi:hypothetical protein P0136_06530 [Lentisphaerota bacterium ZTH]|nr:hypothetical protein JYG24_02360 [Lentisphaerota bacterium]WET07646.1 hypothetical protein P0136_06530 [Lentisphaerota bacterium ZTH]